MPRSKYRDNVSRGVGDFLGHDHACLRLRCLARIACDCSGADRLPCVCTSCASCRNRHHRRSRLRQQGARGRWTLAVGSARQVRRDVRLRLGDCGRCEVLGAHARRLPGHVLHVARPRPQYRGYEGLSREDQQALHYVPAARRPDGRAGGRAPKERRGDARRHHPAYRRRGSIAHRARSRRCAPRRQWISGFAAGGERPREHR